jgi:putative NADH-flavin reductase
MRLTVLGGTGRIGRLIVEQALTAGDDVTVLVRDPQKLGPITERVRVVPGSVSDPAVVRDAVAAADAVISAIGPDGNTADQVVALRDGMRTVIEAMRETGVGRIVNLSGAAVDVPGDHKPMIDRFASRIVRLVSGHVVGAKQAEFDELLASGFEWVAVRPPLVTDGPHTGRYRAGLDVLHPGARISRADIADFMLAQAAEPTFAQAAPFICYR